MSSTNLEPGLRAAGQALDLQMSDHQVETLLSYLALLQRWNATYNLTAVRDPVEMLTQHLADCLAVIHPLRRQIGSLARRLLDVGSGGGLPGVVVSVMLPHLEVTCVDAVGKKAAFVRQAAAELRLDNLRSEHCRVEQLNTPLFDVIASRAFAPLAQYFALTRHLLLEQGCWMAMKAKLSDRELDVGPEVDVFHVEQIEVPGLTADRCLVWARPGEQPSSNR